MTSRESPSGSDGGRRESTTRRTFLRATGTVAGLGLSTTAASGAVGDPSGGAVTIAASPGQRDAVRAAVDRVRATDATADVSLRPAETTAGLDRFAAGDVDALVGDRPMLPAERSRAVERGVDYDRFEVPTATAALRHPESAWVDCLSPAGIAETWAGEGRVETWAEAAPDAAGSAASPHEPVGEPLAERGTGRSRVARAQPTQDGTALVRGVRSFQYASGFGGVGYYEPDGDWVASRTDEVERDGLHTPLVRLGYLYVDRDARRPVDDFVRAFTHLSADRVGPVPYFDRPFGSA